MREKRVERAGYALIFGVAALWALGRFFRPAPSAMLGVTIAAAVGLTFLGMEIVSNRKALGCFWIALGLVTLIASAMIAPWVEGGG